MVKNDAIRQGVEKTEKYEKGRKTKQKRRRRKIEKGEQILYINQKDLAYVLLMPLAETIKKLISFILRGVDLIDHTSIFLLRTINHYVIFTMCILS